jgi:prepilin-type N-terminal cleavage/methylation domain-containing protein/prepilin-type processing-associated H-X9-DG protein
MVCRKRSGFTLVELLVVIAIIAILVFLLLPAINSLRESARRAQCMNHMSQLIMALNSYQMAQGVYPPGVTNPGGPILNQEQGMHQSWIVHLLPYIEEVNVYRMIDHSVGVYHKNNQPARSLHLVPILCPSAMPSLKIAESNYAGVHHDVESPIDSDNHGVLFLNSRLSDDDVTDGTRYTLFIGEKIDEPGDDLGWMSGTRATLRNTGTPLNKTGPNAPGSQSLTPEQIERFDVEGTLDEEVDEAIEFDEDAPESQGDAVDSEDQEATKSKSRTSTETSSSDNANGAGAVAPLDPAELQTPSSAAASMDPQVQLLRNQGRYVGGFGSQHPGGALFAYGDGHVAFLPDSIDLRIYQVLGHRSDGTAIDAGQID